ncbi:MAG: glutamate--tRNA ligase [Candidatus Pacebacteria bacterium]|nr:glutamate--tRNA ligase [Candidatus Paceibacterota bacterium]
MAEENNRKVVTRFAPSPTGFMHVGGVRTALFAWLWARKNNGTFILRIEDTDKEREVSGSIDHIIESLSWLGLNWDEGPDIEGPYAPYIQSKRLETYKKYAQILIDKGYAYPDPYEEDEVNTFREKAEIEGRPFLYREHRPESYGVWDGTKPLRFKVPVVKTYEWNDIVYGNLSAGPEALDDFVLIKSDGYPTYNFAHIVDDIEMGVTHVMRGEEFISSTPKFLSVYEALGILPPLYATLPVILGPDGKKKLGKRDGAKDLLLYREDSYIPDAFINFLAFLGWNPGDDRDIFSRQELIESFDLRRIQKSGAQMNQDKLDWINKEHIKRMSYEEQEKNVLEWLPEQLKNPKLTPILIERINKWSDIMVLVEKGELDWVNQYEGVSVENIVFKDTPRETTIQNIKNAIKVLEEIDENDFLKEKIKEVLFKLAETLPRRGELLHPVRYALSGKDQSPDPFIIGEILGKDETISRLQKAIL